MPRNYYRVAELIRDHPGISAKGLLGQFTAGRWRWPERLEYILKELQQTGLVTDYCLDKEGGE